MTHQQFNQLHDTQKTTALCEYGEFVGERIEEYYDILVYQVSDFFVELFYNHGSNEIAHLHSFSQVSKLAQNYSRNVSLLN
jgi:hypothetical protein